MSDTNLRITKPAVHWTISGILAFIVIFVSYIQNFWLSNTKCLLIAICYIIVTLIYCARDFSSRYVLFGFNITYYIFLISGAALSLFHNTAIVNYLEASPAAAAHTCHVIAMSIITVNTTAIFLLEQNKIRLEFGFRNIFIHGQTRLLILCFFIASMFFKFGTSYIRYRATAVFGYHTIYQYTISMPEYIRIPASVFYISLCLWLITMPAKKQFLTLSFFVLLIEGVIFMSGDRGESMSTILFLLFYVFSRSKTDEDFIQIKATHLILLFLLLPMLIYMIQFVNFSRKHLTMSSDNFFTEFCESQGISACVISHGYDMKSDISQVGGHNYSTGSLRTYLLHNALSRKLLGTKRLTANTEEVARSGDSYGSTMAYLRFKYSYLYNGVGCGTSYIAELWHDGGLKLLTFGNILLGCILFLITKMSNGIRGIFPGAVFMLMTIYILQIPRDNCFSWLTGSLSVNNLIVLGLIAFLHWIGERNEAR